MMAGLAPNSREAVIWNNDATVFCRIYNSLGVHVLVYLACSAEMCSGGIRASLNI